MSLTIHYTYHSSTVAYTGFHKGGPNFLWTLMLTQRRGQTRFSYFFIWPKLIFFAEGRPWPICLPLFINIIIIHRLFSVYKEYSVPKKAARHSISVNFMMHLKSFSFLHIIIFTSFHRVIYWCIACIEEHIEFSFRLNFIFAQYELKRLYTQLQIYKTKTMRQDNPHISKRRGGRKQTHRRFSLQAFHNKHKRHHSEHGEHGGGDTEVSRTPEESTNSAEGVSVYMDESSVADTRIPSVTFKSSGLKGK